MNTKTQTAPGRPGSRIKIAAPLVIAGFVLMLIATAISQSVPYTSNPLNEPTFVGILFWAGVGLAVAPPAYAAGRIVVDFFRRLFRLLIRLLYDRT